METFRFSVVIEKDESGYYVFCPEFQGGYSQGSTYEEALENISDAICLHIGDRISCGEVMICHTTLGGYTQYDQ